VHDKAINHPTILSAQKPKVAKKKKENKDLED
jgi:hypothetical protein